MSSFTRAEISAMLVQFEEKAKKLPGNLSPDVTCEVLKGIKQELDNCPGAPTVKLRELARIVKHYLEEAKDKPDVAYQHFLFAVDLYNRGKDVQSAMKKARVEYSRACEDKHHPARKQFKKLIPFELEVA